MKTLAKEPKDRYPSASVVAEALRHARLRSQPEAPGETAAQGAVWSAADGNALTAAMPTPTPRPPRVPPTRPPRSDSAPARARTPRAPASRTGGPTGAARYTTRRTPAWLFALPVVALAVVVGGALAVWSTGSRPEQAPAASAGSMTYGTPAPTLAASSPPLPTPAPAAATVPTAAPSARTVVAAPTAPTAPPSARPTVPTSLATLPLTPATPVPAPVRGEIWIVVTPWAEVSVDGQEMGPTPVRTPLDPGKHDVVLSHPEYQPVRRKVTVTSGQVFRLEIDLSQDALRR
jgi:hypothetical protein